MTDPNEWNDWSVHILKELERNEKDHEKFFYKLGEIHDDILMLKTKAAVWGSLAGTLFGALGALLIRVYGG